MGSHLECWLDTPLWAVFPQFSCILIEHGLTAVVLHSEHTCLYGVYYTCVSMAYIISSFLLGNRVNISQLDVYF